LDALGSAYAGCESVGRRLNAIISMLEPSGAGVDGPLRGVPVAVKDNIDVRGAATTNASMLGAYPPAERDATLVARLRDAGAEIVCKTNLLEYAAGSVHPDRGRTSNPRDERRTAGGSSGGSAALVGAGVLDHAIGTDTTGSVRVPAAYCGVVGLKPTNGQLPMDGVFPLAPTLDAVGMLTRTVAQAAALFSAMSGRPCEPRPCERVRVGILRAQVDDPDLDPQVRARVVEAIESRAGGGIQLVDVALPELELAEEAVAVIVLREAYDVHRVGLKREPERYAPGTRELLALGAGVDDRAYGRALATRVRVRDAAARVFEAVDVLVGPTVFRAAPLEDGEFGDPAWDRESRYTGPYNLSGHPAISLPCGVVEGDLPVGLQLAAALNADALLLSVASLFESPAPA
jgi:aspartyl-tRNA(Asn)/glutamyl-tRNA(Gln) amidotransferase subunit A